MACFRAVYSGSRSIRGGTWLDLETFGALVTEVLSVFWGSNGVPELAEGRLKAAGSMSGMLNVGFETAYTASLSELSRDH